MTGNEPNIKDAHESHMRRCIELALIAKNRGDTPVGSIVVLNGKIIGEGIEELPTTNNLSGHAELLACQDAVNHTGSRQLAGTTLYTTAEPCFMCSYAIRQSRISLVVYGVETPDVGGVTSVTPILTETNLAGWASPPAVVAGVLLKECRRFQLGTS